MEALSQFFDPNTEHFRQLIAAVVAFSALFLLRSFKGKLLEQSQGNLFGASLYASYAPAKSFLLLASLWYSIELVVMLWQFNLDTKQYPIVHLLTAIALSWYGFRVVNTIERASLTETDDNKLDRTAVIGIAKVSRLLLTIVLVIVAFDLLGLDPSGLIALGGVSGAALAFASKDLVSNWFGGIMLYLDKPFKVGDWIRSPDREIEGTVEYIGWRITKIRTFDKRPLYVPNSLFNNITVQNPSRMTHRRIYESIGIRYDDVEQVKGIVSAIEAYVKTSPVIDSSQTVIVNFNGFGASSLDIMVYCMTITTDWETFHSHKQQVLLGIADIVLEHGAEFAFPTQTLHIEKPES